MTIEQMMGFLKAFSEGKSVQYKSANSLNEAWQDCTNYSWDFRNYTYRMKPAHSSGSCDISDNLLSIQVYNCKSEKRANRIIVSQIDSGVLISPEAGSMFPEYASYQDLAANYKLLCNNLPVTKDNLKIERK